MDDLQDQLSEMMEKMPAFPTSVDKVVELSSDINCNYKDLIKVIEHDPVMTFKVLKMVNSAYFGLPRKITSINHAVVYVGFNTIKNLAVSIASIGILPYDNEAGMNMKDFLLHSLSTAALTRFLAKQMNIPEKDASDFFVAGLLHDFGKIVFVQFMPELYRQVLSREEDKESMFIIDAEREVTGTDHAQVGALLGEKWNLPSHLQEGIRSHHSAQSDDDNSNSLLINLVFIANMLSNELEENDDLESFSEGLIKDITSRCGSGLDDCIASPEGLREEIKKSLQFMER